MNDFRERLDVMKQERARGFNWIFGLAAGFIGLVFCLIIAWYVFIGYVAVKTVDHIDKHGAKSIVERVWEGPGGPKFPAAPKPIE